MRQLIADLKRRFVRPSETLDGYDDPELVDVIFRKTQAYQPREAWPEIAGTSSVLDFGGGCGLHYKLARLECPDIRWAVVETPAMVERAHELSTDRLRFFTSIASAAEWLGPFDLMHSNSALQYAADPESALRQLCSLRANRMIWKRIALSDGCLERDVQLSLLGYNGPGVLPGIKEKNIRYIRTKIPEAMFLKAHAEYSLIERGSDWFRFSLSSR